MSKYPVTQAQWRTVAGWPAINRSLTPDPSCFKGNNRPVENVNWEDAVEFCARLGKNIARAYRLPTEAEWEYACRAGTTTPFAFGETITPEFVNFLGKKTVPVGSLKMANAFRLFDMHGNVWEWCQDWYGKYYSYSASPAADPQGPSTGKSRVIRGGSWFNDSSNCRSAIRVFNRPDTRLNLIGFRVALSAPTA